MSSVENGSSASDDGQTDQQFYVVTFYLFAQHSLRIIGKRRYIGKNSIYIQLHQLVVSGSASTKNDNRSNQNISKWKVGIE